MEQKENRFHVEPQTTTITSYDSSDMLSPGPSSKKQCLMMRRARSIYYLYVIIAYPFLYHLITSIITLLHKESINMSLL